MLVAKQRECRNNLMGESIDQNGPNMLVYTSRCIKQLLAVTHGGDIWLYKIISIDVDIIANTIGLPSHGMDPTQFLDDKTKGKELAKEMKKNVDATQCVEGTTVR
jgi:hypothetical protein